MRNGYAEADPGTHRFLTLLERGQDSVAIFRFNLTARHQQIHQLNDGVPAFGRLHFRDNLISGEKFGQRHADPEWGEKLIVGSSDDKRDLVTNRSSTAISAVRTTVSCPFNQPRDAVNASPARTRPRAVQVNRPTSKIHRLLGAALCNSDDATVTTAHRTCRSWRGPRDYPGRICFGQNGGGDDLPGSQPTDTRPPSPAPG